MPSPNDSFSIARNSRSAAADAGAVPAPSVPVGGFDEPLPLTFLVDIAEGLASVDDLWRPFLHDDLTERPATRLIATERWEAWLLEWDAGHSVELHDHGPSAGAFTVVTGRLIEVRADTGGLVSRREASGGHTRSFTAGTRHDVLNLSAGPAASIHIYSPPLTSMTFFDPISFEPLRTEAVEPTRAVLDGDPAPMLHPSRVP
jgi:hypothetical protein